MAECIVDTSLRFDLGDGEIVLFDNGANDVLCREDIAKESICHSIGADRHVGIRIAQLFFCEIIVNAFAGIL